ncbi:MAG: septum formation initiator family protein [Proteobacteria bacterium]|nr:septum formation initiator family protein [Pseudomonadota bacterium]
MIFIFFIVAVSVVAVFGDKGLVEAYGLKKHRDSIIAHVDLLKAENSTLEDEIALLKDDKRYVEMVARKDLGMIGKDEIIYMLRD